jgi:antitoxin (DNA-binding transcriptional repressor) of toxin-antitoxin stability system
MQTMPLDWATGRLAEIVEKLSPGEEIVLTRNDQPVATLRATPSEKPRPVLGRGKGMLIILAEDDEHLKDFAEYVP